MPTPKLNTRDQSRNQRRDTVSTIAPLILLGSLLLSILGCSPQTDNNDFESARGWLSTSPPLHEDYPFGAKQIEIAEQTDPHLKIDSVFVPQGHFNLHDRYYDITVTNLSDRDHYMKSLLVRAFFIPPAGGSTGADLYTVGPLVPNCLVSGSYEIDGKWHYTSKYNKHATPSTEQPIASRIHFNRPTRVAANSTFTFRAFLIDDNW